MAKTTTADSIVVKWKDPGVRPGVKNDYKAIVAALQANPGKWALVAEDVALTTADYLKARYGCDVARRNCRGSRGDVYARWPEAS